MSEGGFLRQALAQAQVSDELVRAPALLRIARVQMASDPEVARRTFDEGLDALQGLPEYEVKSLWGIARMLAAAVAPELVDEIRNYSYPLQYIEAEELVRIMLEHERVDDAISFVTRSHQFPFGRVSAVMYKVDDAAVRLAILRRAIAAWRAMIDLFGLDEFSRFTHLPASFISGRFIELFKQQWKLLPEEEAWSVTHDIVNLYLGQPDPRSAPYGPLTSRRQSQLFEILHILRHLDPALADSLIAANEQLAGAARRYPNGAESIQQEKEAQRRAAGTPQSGARAGSSPWPTRHPQDVSSLDRLVRASEDGDFGPPMEDALERFRKDTAPEAPNRAPRELWRSTYAYRQILYIAGKRLDSAAAAYLDGVPDSDLRLFAQIELAAALMGLPELPGMQLTNCQPLY